MTMVNLRHKRSAARLISLPSLEASSTPFSVASPVPALPSRNDKEGGNVTQQSTATRWSSESLTPSNGYSGLFTSGILRQQPLPSPTLSSFPSPPSTHVSHKAVSSVDETKTSISYQQHSPQHLAPPSNSFSPRSNAPSTPRRRSSIIHQTPSSVSPRLSKSGGPDHGVEKALEGVMRSLKLYATVGTPKAGVIAESSQEGDEAEMPQVPIDGMVSQRERWSSRQEKYESRWSSSSSEDSLETGESGGNESFWRSRKSSGSARSRGTTKSSAATSTKAKSVKSLRGRKSEESMRSALGPTFGGFKQEEDVPPVPAPVTPSRSRRMMEGIAKRLGLTPRKLKAAADTPPMPSSSDAMMRTKHDNPAWTAQGSAQPQTPSGKILRDSKRQPGVPMGLPPPPPPTDRQPPRKSSLSNLRSALSKKGSSTTLRSIRSIAAIQSIPTNTGTATTPPMPSSHPFMNPHHSASALTLDCETPSPAHLGTIRSFGVGGTSNLTPRKKEDQYGFYDGSHTEGCLPPMTPRRRSGSGGIGNGGSGRRTPKSSIGLPKLVPSTSPSVFLKEMPRKAPTTPKREPSDLNKDDASVIPLRSEDAMDIEMEIASGIEREVLAEIRESMGLGYPPTDDVDMEDLSAADSLKPNLSISTYLPTTSSSDESSSFSPEISSVDNFSTQNATTPGPRVIASEPDYPPTPDLVDDSMEDQSLAYGIYTPDQSRGRQSTISNTHYSFHLETETPPPFPNPADHIISTSIANEYDTEAELFPDEILGSSTPILTAKAIRAQDKAKPKPSRILQLLPASTGHPTAHGVQQKRRHLGSMHTPLSFPSTAILQNPNSTPSDPVSIGRPKTPLGKEKKSFENLRQVFRSPGKKGAKEKEKIVVGLPAPSPSPYTSLVEAHRNNFGGYTAETPSRPSASRPSKALGLGLGLREPLGDVKSTFKVNNIIGQARSDNQSNWGGKGDGSSRSEQTGSATTKPIGTGLRGVEYFDRFRDSQASSHSWGATFGRSVVAPLNIRPKIRQDVPKPKPEVFSDDQHVGEALQDLYRGDQHAPRESPAWKGSIGSREEWELETYLKDLEGSQGSCS